MPSSRPVARFWYRTAPVSCFPSGGGAGGCSRPAVPGAQLSSWSPGITRGLGLLERMQVGGEVAGGGEGVRVVITQHAAAPGQGVLVQFPRRPWVTQRAQAAGEVAGGGKGVGVVVTQHAAAPGQGVFV